MKPALAALVLAAALLSGCGKEETAPVAATPAPAAPVETAPAPAPVAPTEAPPPAEAAVTNGTTPPAAEAAAPAPAAPAPVAVDPATIPAPQGPAPVEGTDYTLIDPPAPLAPAPGKIEVAEVFAYYCIHCATTQQLVTPWKAALPADVDFKYVPMAHGQVEPLARGFYAAEAMGINDTRVHEGMFDAIAVQKKLTSAEPQAVADLYGGLGADSAAVLATMQSFAVNAQIVRAQKAITRWAIEATPTFVVAGKYRVTGGGQRALQVVDHLLARERAAAAGTNSSP